MPPGRTAPDTRTPWPAWPERIAVGVQRDSENPQARTALVGFRRAIGEPDADEVWEEWARWRQGSADGLHVGAEAERLH